jgi:broad specificity phosphatase PhoE
MAHIYYLRHGETEWNTEGRVCGHTDVPLSDAGRQQACLLAERLKSLRVDVLYSSPLRRALDTARIVAEAIGHTPVVDIRLMELNYGEWEGRTFDEIERADPLGYQAWVADPGRLAPPRGESGEQLIERAAPFFNLIASRYGEGNVAVVCHKTVGRLFACHILGAPLANYRRRVVIDNASLNIFVTGKDGWRVAALNDTSHLAGNGHIDKRRVTTDE